MGPPPVLYSPSNSLGSLQVLTHTSFSMRGKVLTGDVSEPRSPDTLEKDVSRGPPRGTETHDPRHQSGSQRPVGHPYHALSGSQQYAWAPDATLTVGVASAARVARTFWARAFSLAELS